MPNRVTLDLENQTGELEFAPPGFPFATTVTLGNGIINLLPFSEVTVLPNIVQAEIARGRDFLRQAHLIFGLGLPQSIPIINAHIDHIEYQRTSTKAELTARISGIPVSYEFNRTTKQIVVGARPAVSMPAAVYWGWLDFLNTFTDYINTL